MKRKEISLTDGVPLLKILIFCSPLFAVSLLGLIQAPIMQSFYSSSSIGTYAFSIPAMFVSFWAVYQSFTSGFNIYSGVKVASYRASNNKELEKKYFMNSFYLTLMVKAVISTLAIVLHKPIFKLLSIPNELYDIVFLYYVLHIVANLLVNVCAVVADLYYGIGSVRNIFILRCISPFITVLSGVVFFKLFDLGMWGLSFVSVPASLVCLIVYLVLIVKNPESNYEKKDFKIDFKVMKEILGGSMIYTVRQFIITITAMICQVKVNASLDKTALTAMGISLPLSSFFQGFGSGSRLFVTKNYAIKNYKYLKKGMNQTIIFLSALALVCMSIYIFLGDAYMSSIGLTGQDKTMAVYYWRTYAFFHFPALVILCSIRFMFEGAGFKTLAFITGFFESAGYLLNAFIFIPYLGDVFAMNYNGVSYTVGAIICLVVYIIKRKNIYHNNENLA